ncbi:hypothetical protein HHI36_015231 [Cryptolaemus montrouzieri]|uniref:Uncharacterized protein n=1 Tax=Cryptolaemus montrouzieri TaxID=559131 RepID=A0ABD2N5A2_9CUCU
MKSRSRKIMSLVKINENRTEIVKGFQKYKKEYEEEYELRGTEVTHNGELVEGLVENEEYEIIDISRN